MAEGSGRAAEPRAEEVSRLEEAAGASPSEEAVEVSRREAVEEAFHPAGAEESRLTAAGRAREEEHRSLHRRPQEVRRTNRRAEAALRRKCRTSRRTQPSSRSLTG